MRARTQLLSVYPSEYSGDGKKLANRMQAALDMPSCSCGEDHMLVLLKVYVCEWKIA
jgi:hypothetical protein